MFIRPGLVVVIVGMTLTSLSTIIVALRYYCRWFRMGTLAATDHLMLTALILTWGITVINYYQDQVSKDFRPSQFRNPDKRPFLLIALKGTLITWWLYRLTYTIALCFVKLSILFFYRAIASHQTFKRLVYGSIVFVCLYTFGASTASIFQCENPGDAFSTAGYLSEFDGKAGRIVLKCYDPIRLWVFTAAVNLFTDVIILLIPIPTLLSLRVPMSKRIALIGVFSVGIMAIVASCVRMWVMALWAQSPSNSARFGDDLLLWGQVEINSGIISASVPFLRLVFRRDSRPVEERRRGISPPRIVQPDNKPLEIETHKFFEAEDVGPNGSPIWKPFITVPASLSSGSRGSAMLEPEHPHQTV